MKKKIIYLSFMFFALFGTTVYGNNKIKFIDNNRLYEPVNVSNTSGLNITAENSLDFSKSDSKKDILEGNFIGNYTIKSNENKNLKLGFILTSNLNDLSKVSLQLDKTDLKYDIKFLSDKLLQPSGNEFYREILKSTNSTYEPVNFKKDSTGLLRIFNLESKDSEKLQYEITVTYDGEKSKVFANGGKNISGNFEKQNKVLKIIHELGGNYKSPTLYVIGDNVVVNTKVMVNGKEINTGYTEKIDRKNVPVIEYMKETFLANINDAVKSKLSDDNIFELFAENFDKILGGVSQDTIGLLNNNSSKLVFLTADLESNKTGRNVEIKYPVLSGVTTINDSKVMKLNMEVSPLDTFEKLSSLNYNIIGSEDYKYVVSSTADYKTIKLGSIINVSDTSKKLIENLMYKEDYLKGISKVQPSKYTSIGIILVGIIQIFIVIYLKMFYKSGVNKRRAIR